MTKTSNRTYHLPIENYEIINAGPDSPEFDMPIGTILDVWKPLVLMSQSIMVSRRDDMTTHVRIASGEWKLSGYGVMLQDMPPMPLICVGWYEGKSE